MSSLCHMGLVRTGARHFQGSRCFLLNLGSRKPIVGFLGPQRSGEPFHRLLGAGDFHAGRKSRKQQKHAYKNLAAPIKTQILGLRDFRQRDYLL
jgi:hypothetical protein